MDWIELALDSV